MKLIHHTLRNLFIPLLAVFAVWGCVFYLMILHEIDDETNDSLENYKELIIRSVVADSTLLKDHVDLMTRYYIREVPAREARLDKDEFYDATVYIDMEMEDEPVRALRTYFMTDDRKYYELVIQTSTVEKEDMIETIVWSMAILYLSLVGCILLVIHFAFRKSFKPLYKLLSWLRGFQVGRPLAPFNISTPVEEFGILTEAVRESVRRTSELYNKQKQFVENASHELQTPLAICMNKLELLSENPDCTEQQFKEIATLHHALNSIIRLNKSLLLLSRIENKQFPDTRDICLNHLAKDILEDFCEMYEHKAIHLIFEDKEPLIYTLNESLASTLIANLIKNAFVHNYEEGTVSLSIDRHTFTIANTAHAGRLDTQSLFNRFSRQTEHKESTGLGLAIVKSIADLYDIRIAYLYENRMHRFRLTFA